MCIGGRPTGSNSKALRDRDRDWDWDWSLPVSLSHAAVRKDSALYLVGYFENDKLRHGGKLYSGRGVSTDIVGASIRAYLSAVNKIVYEERGH